MVVCTEAVEGFLRRYAQWLATVPAPALPSMDGLTESERQEAYGLLARRLRELDYRRSELEHGFAAYRSGARDFRR